MDACRYHLIGWVEMHIVSQLLRHYKCSNAANENEELHCVYCIMAVRWVFVAWGQSRMLLHACGLV